MILILFRSASDLVHSYNVSAAEELLVSAVRMRKDIVFDGTMTWFPFIQKVNSLFFKNIFLIPFFKKDY